MGGKLEALLFLASSGFCGWLGGRALAPAGRWPARAISYLLAWLLALVLPVQATGALEIVGAVERASLLHATWIAIGIGVLAWWATRRRKLPSTQEPGSARLRFPTWFYAALAIVLLAYGLLALRMFLLYPAGWDSLLYHFPLAAKWLQEGTMGIPASRAWQFSLPSNANITFLVFMATGKQSLLPVANVAAVLMLALSVYVIALRIGSTRVAAGSVALITLSIPIIHHQSFSGYIDLFGTAAMMASLALFLSRRKSDGSTDARVVLAAALACGLCVGTKPNFFVYAPIFLGVAMFGLVWEPNRSERGAIPWMAVLLAGMLLPSAFWFWRATLETGNPVFPLEIKVGDTILLPGFAASDVTPVYSHKRYVTSNWQWLIYPWSEWRSSTGYLHLFYGVDSGLGGAYATFVPLGLAVAAWQVARNVYRRVSPRTMMLAVWVLLFVIWFVALRRLPRFGLPVWSLACALSGFMLSLAWRYRPFWTGALLSATLAATMAVSSAGPVYELAASVYFNRFSRAGIYGYANFIDRLPPGSRVVNRVNVFNFWFYGEGLTNYVIPNFEQPEVLTRAYLNRVRADYVVEAVRPGEPRIAPAEALTLEAEELRGQGDEQKIWRLWAVDKSTHPTDGRRNVPRAKQASGKHQPSSKDATSR